MSQKNTYLISTNPLLAEWIVQQGIAKHVIVKIELELANFEHGDIVIGDLPVPLVAQLAAQGVHYGHLTAMNKPGVEVQWFNVSKINHPGHKPAQTLHDGILTDWDEDQAERQSYRVTIDNEYQGINVVLKKDQNSESEPALNLYIEVNKGVPAVHVCATEFGDNDLHIHSAPDGLYVTPEVDGSLGKAPVNAFSYDQPHSLYVPVDRSPVAEDAPSF